MTAHQMHWKHCCSCLKMMPIANGLRGLFMVFRNTLLPVPSHEKVIKWCSEPMSIVSMTNGAIEGSHPVFEPPPAHGHGLSGLNPNSRLCWKPPNLKEPGQWILGIIRLRVDGMSRPCLHTPKRPSHCLCLSPQGYDGPLLFHPHPLHELWDMATVSADSHRAEGSYSPESLPAHSCCPLLGLKLDRRLIWKPPDVMEMEQHIRDVVKSSDGTSRAYSHGHIMVLMLVHYAHLLDSHGSRA